MSSRLPRYTHLTLSFQTERAEEGGILRRRGQNGIAPSSGGPKRLLHSSDGGSARGIALRGRGLAAAGIQASRVWKRGKPKTLSSRGREESPSFPLLSSLLPLPGLMQLGTTTIFFQRNRPEKAVVFAMGRSRSLSLFCLLCQPVWANVTGLRRGGLFLICGDFTDNSRPSGKGNDHCAKENGMSGVVAARPASLGRWPACPPFCPGRNFWLGRHVNFVEGRGEGGRA